MPDHIFGPIRCRATSTHWAVAVKFRKTLRSCCISKNYWSAGLMTTILYRTYLGVSKTVRIACSNSFSFRFEKSTFTAHPSPTIESTFVFWSIPIGIPTIGTPWYFDSATLPNPQCEMNNFRFLCAKTPSCGNHLLIKTFSGFPSSSSVSHFMTTRCLSFEKTFSKMSIFSRWRKFVFAFDPKLKRTAPSLEAPSSQSWIFWKIYFNF